MSEVAIVTVSEKGQIVLPKKMRDLLKMEEGSKLFVEEKKGQIVLTKMENKLMDAPQGFFSPKSFAKTWENEEEDRAWKDL